MSGLIHENHRGIDEGVLSAQLRREWAGFIPIGAVLQLNGSARLYFPRLLVDFFDRRACCAHMSFHLLDVAAEIPDLIQRIPPRHLNGHFARDVRNSHHDVKQMSFRIGNGNFIQYWSVFGTPGGLHRVSQRLRRAYRDRDDESDERISRLHRLLAPAGCGSPAGSFFNSFSHKPSKLPLDIISSKSPALASAAR